MLSFGIVWNRLVSNASDGLAFRTDWPLSGWTANFLTISQQPEKIARRPDKGSEIRRWSEMMSRLRARLNVCSTDRRIKFISFLLDLF